ncbi:MAG: DegV family protein [Nocardioidaceae bacterium]
MPAPVAIVTDSTASLTADEVETTGVVVVPLQVVIGNTSYEEGVDPEASPESVATALREWVPVSTSRPSPARVLQAYQAAAEGGARHLVSIHLSKAMSATYESAVLASKESPVPVTVVDSRQVGRATGLAVLRAAGVLAGGGSAEQVAETARLCGEATTTLLYVDTLEYLRRGGRIGAASALIGGALAVKPLLQVVDGVLSNVEKVRTSARALGRLTDLALAAVGDGRAVVSVAHLANEERAHRLADALAARLGDQLEGVIDLQEVGAVVGAHTGPGMVGVTLAPLSLS